jgi:anti-sigma regulatory factor (Ser/Thr protein kinase)
MEVETINLPPIRDDDNGYSYIFRLAKNIMDNPHRYFNFNFKNCSVVDQNAIAMFGGLAKHVNQVNSFTKVGITRGAIAKYKIKFEIDSMSENVKKKLIKNNFLSFFNDGSCSGFPKGDYVGYREHTDYLDAEAIVLHLRDQWLSDEKIHISADLKNSIVSKVLEIFMNAYGHSEKTNEAKVISCGEYDEKEKNLKLTVMDFGVGIIENVQAHLKKKLKEVDAMEWALQTGNSTKTDSIDEDIPRGLGFGVLNEFVRVNKGNIRVYSNNCYASTDKDGDYSVSKLNTNFPGTLVTITINCDDRYYKFLNEPDDDNYF